MADLSVAELRALYAAAQVLVLPPQPSNWQLRGEVFRRMAELAGRNWHSNLRKALAEVSRELAKADFEKETR